MQLLLCYLLVGPQAPYLFLPDKLTDNPDIRELEILTATLHHYPSPLLVASHNAYFLGQLPEPIG
ncbi:hypothetical protein [Hymenobacter sp. HSC-4F20]|uniref:hypothetical protein n=1 Tax=Hymenobacter sp. HSC-4F20 TaxID=2864135 RepID=UPI001C73BBBE|nr:hypothetical protein [Hymenobacter sp. HSC-4F20]